MELRKYEVFMIFALFIIALLMGAGDMRKIKKMIAVKGIFFISLISIILWALTPNAGVDIPEIVFILILLSSGFKAYKKDVMELFFMAKEFLFEVLKIFLRKIL